MSTPLDQVMRQADPVEFSDLPTVTGGPDDQLYAVILDRTQLAAATRVSPQRRFGPLVAAAAFATVLIVVGVIALFSSSGADRDVVDEPTPTQVPSTSLVPPTTSALQEAAASTTAAPQATTTTEAEEENELPDYPLGPSFDLRPIATDLDSVHAALSIDGAGRLYLADWDFSNRIYRVSVDGSVETWAETELLSSAHSSAFGPDGRLYVTSNENGLLLAFSEDGTADVVTDQLSRPTGILFLPDGRLIVADAGPSAILEVLGHGSVQEFARHDFFHEPQGLDLDDAGNIYVTNWANARLQRISSTGEIEDLHQFPDVLVDVLHRDGVLYIAGRGESLIYRYVLADGTVEVVADAAGGALSHFAPVSLEAGPSGGIYLTYETPTSVGVLTPDG